MQCYPIEPDWRDRLRTSAVPPFSDSVSIITNTNYMQAKWMPRIQRKDALKSLTLGFLSAEVTGSLAKVIRGRW